MNWFALSLLSVGFLATAELTQQHLLNRKEAFTPRTSLVLVYLFNFLLVIPFALILHRQELLNVFENGAYYKSFRVKNISFSTIFISISVVVSTSLGIVFFGESTAVLKFLGIGLILAAIVGSNYRNIAIEPNHLFGLLAGVLFGICYVIDKGVVGEIPPIIYIFWNFPLTGLFCFLGRPREVVRSVRDKSWITYRPVVLSAMGYFLYNVLTFTAYTQSGEVGRIDAINNSQIFLIILFEFLVFKHRKQIGRKLTMAALAYTGVLILGLS